MSLAYGFSHISHAFQGTSTLGNMETIPFGKQAFELPSLNNPIENFAPQVEPQPSTSFADTSSLAGEDATIQSQEFVNPNFANFQEWAKTFNENPGQMDMNSLISLSKEEYPAIINEQATAMTEMEAAATNQQQLALEALEDAGEIGVETGEAAIETGEAVTAGVESYFGPVGIGMMLAKQAGDTINDLQTTNLTNQNTAQFTANMTGGFGIGYQQQANMVREWNQSQIADFKTSGEIASWFSPLAVGITDAIDRANLDQIPQKDLDTAWTSFGRIDPQSDNVNITFSSSSINPSEMTDGEQTSTTTNSIDTSVPS